MPTHSKVALLLSSLGFVSLATAKSVDTTFPKDFAFGVATAAYQIEGAYNEDGKGRSIWDDFVEIPGVIDNGDDGKVADDFYHRYQEDIDMMKGMGVKHFRMSISWPRVLPNGRVDNVNKPGVNFYHKVLDSLLAADIEPWVTLYHWDLPSTLNDRTSTGGWLNPEMPEIFNSYADFCFKEFGSKIKKWLTINEPSSVAWLGYGSSQNAPGRCSPSVNARCESVGGGGNSTTEPNIVSHHLLLAHGLATRTYRQKYQVEGGEIGMTINAGWGLPWDAASPNDTQAVIVGAINGYSYYGDPMFFGKYPDIMVQQQGELLPKFTPEQAEMMKGSCDFFGVNHYGSSYQHMEPDGRVWGSPYNKTGNLIGPFAESKWLNVFPSGIRGLLNFVHNRYNGTKTYVFENGVSVPNENSQPLEVALHDQFRVDFYRDYITEVGNALNLDKVNIQGYFAWSLMDNFEWNNGYSVRFGLVYVDYKNKQTRHKKDSCLWFEQLLKNHKQEHETSELELPQF